MGNQKLTGLNDKARPLRWLTFLLAIICPVVGKTAEVQEILYPNFLVFRSPQRVWQRIGALDEFTDANELEQLYGSWSDSYSIFSGMVVKHLQEEIPLQEFATLSKFVNRLAGESESLVLSHFNLRARLPSYKLGAQLKMQSQNWLYYPGTTALSIIKSDSVHIVVEDVSVFRTDIGIRKKVRELERRFTDPLVIVPVNASGKKMWSRAEHVSLLEINPATSTIEIKRDLISRKDFSGDDIVWIAPHVATGPWSREMLWAYNHAMVFGSNSTHDVLLSEFHQLLDRNGDMSSVDGVVFDLAFYEPIFLDKNRAPDFDNDGIADKFNSKGVLGYRNGVEIFLSALRRLAGEEFLLVADGQNPTNQRAVGFLNGIELEGYAGAHSRIHDISNVFNVTAYWQAKVKLKNRIDFSYLVPKRLDPAGEQYFDIAVAAASIAGISVGVHGVPNDPVFKRAKVLSNKLGRPIGEKQLLGKVGKPMAPRVKSREIVDTDLSFNKEKGCIFDVYTKSSITPDLTTFTEHCSIEFSNSSSLLPARFVFPFEVDLLSTNSNQKAVPIKIQPVTDQGISAYKAGTFILADKEPSFKNELYVDNIEGNVSAIRFTANNPGRYKINIAHPTIEEPIYYRAFEHGLVLLSLAVKAHDIEDLWKRSRNRSEHDLEMCNLDCKDSCDSVKKLKPQSALFIIGCDTNK